MTMVTVSKLAKCKRCGDSQVAWLQSNAGKWYLATAYKDGHLLVANPAAPHRCKGIQEEGAVYLAGTNIRIR